MEFSENSMIKRIKELALFETNANMIILPRTIEEFSPIQFFGFHISNSPHKILTIKTEKTYIFIAYDGEITALDLSFLQNYNYICLEVPLNVQIIDSTLLVFKKS